MEFKFDTPTDPDNLPAPAGMGILDTVKQFVSTVAGVIITALVILATVAAPQIMLPVLALYGVYKFAATATDAQGSDAKTKKEFSIWLFLVILALIVFTVLKLRKKI